MHERGTLRVKWSKDLSAKQNHQLNIKNALNLQPLSSSTYGNDCSREKKKK